MQENKGGNKVKKWIIALLLSFSLVLVGCNQASEEVKEAEQKVEEKAEEAKEKVEEKAEEAKKEVEEKVEEVKEELEGEPVELTVSAAASLTDAMEEIKGIYEDKHKNVTLTFNFGASGTLQNQIEEGAKVDVFVSAAQKQMNELIDKEMVDQADAADLLVNDVVLITTTKRDDINIEKIEDLVNEDIKTVALGEPGGVPVGQYSEEILTNLGILDEVKKKFLTVQT